MKLINLKRSEKKAKRDMEVTSSDGYKEYYPWGFSLNLDQETIPKFKALKNVKIGKMVDIHAVGKLTGISINESEGSDKSQNITIQIQRINIMSKGSDKDAFDEYAE